MKKHTLIAELRTLKGRKVKQVRLEGKIPATVYGKNITSVSIQVRTELFAPLYKIVGETGLIELAIANNTWPVLVHSVQKHPVNGGILHVEFHQVDLKEKVKANVPVELVGEAKAVVDKIGVLLTLLDEVEVEALPAQLPEKIEVDVSSLAEVNQEFKVSDLNIPSGVTLLSDPTVVVVKIGALVTKEVEAEAKAEEEAAQAVAATKAVPAQGEQATPKEAGGEEEKKSSDQKTPVQNTPEKSKQDK